MDTRRPSDGDDRPRPEPRSGDGGADEDEDQSDDDDPDLALDRAFGLEPHVVAPRTPRQRTRTAVLVAVVVLVAGGLIAATLVVVVGSVQTGIGGVFPQPQASLDRFEDGVSRLPDVASVTDLSERQTAILAGYDVTALVRAQGGLTDGAQQQLVADLSQRTDAESGNGVSVYAQVEFGDVRVAVSPDDTLSTKRLATGRTLAAMDGVTTVRCGWSVPSGEPITDTAARQVVTVRTSATDADYPGVVSAVTTAAHATLPDARVTVTRTAASTG